MVWEAISYNSWSHLVLGKVNSARYIAQVVNPVLASFIRQEGDVLLSRATHVHIQLLQHNVLFVVHNNCPCQQDPQISRQLNTSGTWWNGNLLFLQSLPQLLPNCDNECKMLGAIYRRMAFGTFDSLHARIHACVAARGGYTVYWCDWAPLTVICVSFGLNLLSYIPTMINYQSHQFEI